MNRLVHNERQSLTVTDNKAGLEKIIPLIKNIYWSYVQFKLEENSYKMSFNSLSPRGQIGLKLL